jgi:hypothetical protein
MGKSVSNSIFGALLIKQLGREKFVALVGLKQYLPNLNQEKT